MGLSLLLIIIGALTFLLDLLPRRQSKKYLSRYMKWLTL